MPVLRIRAKSVCVYVCVRVCFGLSVVCFELSCLRAWGLGATPRTHTSIDNELGAEGITALVPVLNALTGLQTLNLRSACVDTCGRSDRVAGAVFDLG